MAEMGLLDLSAELTDFAETAAVIANMASSSRLTAQSCICRRQWGLRPGFWFISPPNGVD